MAKPAKSVLGDVGEAGGGGSEDADAILDTGLAIIRRDLERIGQATARLGFEDAQTVAGYVRALGGIARARNSRGGRDLNKASMEDLMKELIQIPEVRAALEASE